MADLLSEQRERLFRLQEALEEAYPGLYHRTKAQVEVTIRDITMLDI